ncbi:MAG TPA: hypothetical protein VGW77_13595 [Candidatus Binatia bacterium]|nr:hypothetical protein [Candidatus Binatia bacterium]
MPTEPRNYLKIFNKSLGIGEIAELFFATLEKQIALSFKIEKNASPTRKGSGFTRLRPV